VITTWSPCLVRGRLRLVGRVELHVCTDPLNAEFVYRGSTIAPTNRITLPASTKEGRTADAVDDRVKAIHRMNAGEALEHARTLWDAMLDASRS
jgi:hypothetical protein